MTDTRTRPPRLRKLLVANRGEIACRVIRTAHRLGWRSVAVFSDADADAPHVALADEAVRIGASPAADSYLRIEAIIEAARRCGADAVHPGYGFLSERAEFADACTAAGLVFVGPPASAIRAMGDKALAKARMLAAGVPCAPGYLGEDQRESTLMDEARRLGWPLLVKAIAGGGGRGMRLVRQADELAAALASARREAESAFGDGRLMLERLIEDGRHIEIQVFADSQGQVVHLGERDCTAQRRRQKVIEEAPSPVVDAALRLRMGEAAVAAARAVGYVGAGTVEFIVDAQRQPYFLEMNTRLQVEHPVTEAITGLDLVEWQLRVAEGHPLPLRQDQIRFEGHAIEARLMAEDPHDGWTPQTGAIAGWHPELAGIRVDHGIAEGGEVTPFYDAMVAKFVAHGRDRADAIRRLVHALEDAALLAPANNGRFLRDLLLDPAFSDGSLTTRRLDDWSEQGHPLLQRGAPPEFAWRVAAAVLGGPAVGRPKALAAAELTLSCGETRRRMRASETGVTVRGIEGGWLQVELDGVRRRWRALRKSDVLLLAIDGAVHRFAEASPYPAHASITDPTRARAAVAGVVAQILVAPGQAVAAGQPLVSVEAMKMEMWVAATSAGTVRQVLVQARQPVAAGTVLVELEITDA